MSSWWKYMNYLQNHSVRSKGKYRKNHGRMCFFFVVISCYMILLLFLLKPKWGFWKSPTLLIETLKTFHHQEAVNKDVAFKSLLRRPPLLVPQKYGRAATLMLGSEPEPLQRVDPWSIFAKRGKCCFNKNTAKTKIALENWWLEDYLPFCWGFNPHMASFLL